MKGPLRIINSIFISILLVSPSLAQNSIIAQIIKSQEAIVSIEAQNVNIGRSAQKQIGRDPRTGRVIVRQNIKAASYQRYGAGVIIHPSGVIVTNYHTVNRANQILVILHDNQKIPAKVIRTIDNLDLALIRIPLPYPVRPIELADSNEIHLGDEVITVGNSEFLKQTISGGKIIGIGSMRQDVKKGRHQTDLIQLDINVYGGDSGGPLFDRQGRLIGMITAGETAADKSTFAIPSNKIKKYLTEYLNSVEY